MGRKKEGRGAEEVDRGRGAWIFCVFPFSLSSFSSSLLLPHRSRAFSAFSGEKRDVFSKRAIKTGNTFFGLAGILVVAFSITCVAELEPGIWYAR